MEHTAATAAASVVLTSAAILPKSPTEEASGKEGAKEENFYDKKFEDAYPQYAQAYQRFNKGVFSLLVEEIYILTRAAEKAAAINGKQFDLAVAMAAALESIEFKGEVVGAILELEKACRESGAAYDKIQALSGTHPLKEVQAVLLQGGNSYKRYIEEYTVDKIKEEDARKRTAIGTESLWNEETAKTDNDGEEGRAHEE